MSTSGIGFGHVTVDQLRSVIDAALEGGVTRVKITNCDDPSRPGPWNVYVQKQGGIGEETSRRLHAPFLRPGEGEVVRT